jgi:hypothetical protein
LTFDGGKFRGERLTNRGIAALKPSDMSVLHSTGGSPSVRSRLSVSQKSFVFDWRENHRQRRKTISQFPAWTVEARARQPPAA